MVELFQFRPITLRQANAFVEANHRHSSAVAGCKFALGLFSGGVTVGVAICGRPNSRVLDNGETLEIARVATNGAYNACSLLYARAIRIALLLGYTHVITYTRQDETGASVKAAGGHSPVKCQKHSWHCSRRPSLGKTLVGKIRWTLFPRLAD